MNFLSQAQYDQLKSASSINARIYRHPLFLTTFFFYLFLGLGIVAVAYLFDPYMFGPRHSDLSPLMYFFIAFDLIFLKITASILRARKKATNWLVQQSDNGLLIKIRSYLNYHLDPDVISIVEIAYSEMTWMRKVNETKIVNTSDGEAKHQSEYLEIKLQTTNSKQLAEHIKAVRKRRAPAVKKWYGSSSTKYQDYPVTMHEDNVLRIEWHVKPSIDELFFYAKGHVVLNESIDTETDTTNVEKLTEDEQTKLIKALLARGDEIQAIKIVKQLYNFDTTEAFRYIGELHGDNRLEELYQKKSARLDYK